MITIISATNRKGSNTLKIANAYQLILLKKGIHADVYSLENMEMENMADFENMEDEILIPTTHFIIISPEYNGSFPGVLKMMIDKSRVQLAWHNKKVLLAGVASGRAGNLRGLDHLSNIMNHLKVTVFPFKLPISTINNVVGIDGEIVDANTIKAINQQLDDFIIWSALNPIPKSIEI